MRKFWNFHVKHALLLAFTLFSGSNRVAAQVFNPSLQTRVANSAADEDRKMACAYSALLLEIISKSDPDELKTSLAQEIARYKSFMESETIESTETIELRKRVLGDLLEAYAVTDQRAYLGASLSLACRSVRTIGGAALSSTALSASLITSAITLPIRFVGKGVIGGFTRRSTPHKGPSYSDLFGSPGMQSELVSLAFEAVRAAFGAGSPLAIPQLIISGVDLQAAKRCSVLNQSNFREKKFCENYLKIKNKEFQWSEVGERIGIKIGTVLLGEFDFRSDDRVNPAICNYPVKKQYRLARRAKERLSLEIAEKNLLNIEISILNPTPNRCITLKLSTAPGFEDEQNQLGTVIDGFAIQRPSAVADEAPASQDGGVCSEIQRQKIWKQSVRTELNQAMGSAIQLALNPSRYAHYSEEAIQMPSDKVSRQELSEMTSGRNIVLMIAPNSEQVRQYDVLKAEEKNLKSKLGIQGSKLKELLKAKNANECSVIQERVKFDWKEYNRLQEDLRSQESLKRINEYRQMSKEAKKAGRSFVFLRSLKRTWELQEMTSLNDVRSLITDASVQNLVIVSHGDIDGKIIDSRFNELPHNAFGWIGPNIQSISFFSCHSQKALETYDLPMHLKTQNSYHQLRIAGYVKTEDFFETSEKVPSGALSEYIETLDHRLDLAEKGTERVQTWLRNRLPTLPGTAICSIQLNGIKVTNGEFGVLVNGKWIGSLYPETDPSSSFNYPCGWIGQNHNTVFFENQSLVEKSNLILDHAEVLSEGRSVKPSQSFLRDDTTIKALRFDLN